MLGKGLSLSFWHKKRKHKISLIIVRNQLDEILLLKRSHTDDWRPGHWGLPGGHVEPGESHIQAAARELLEEANVIPINLRSGFTYDGIEIFYTDNWMGPVSLRDASHGFEHMDWLWIHPSQLKSLKKKQKVVPTLKSDKFVKQIQSLG